MPDIDSNILDSSITHSNNLQDSLSASGLSTSRPFLNMMNPMGRSHKGYMLANQSVLEEDERDDRGDDDDLEAGRNESPLFHNPASSSTPSRTQKSKTSRSPRKVSWNPSASEMNSFRPNIQHQDKIQEEEESDDEVPQSFMIEAAEGTTPSRASKGKARETMKSVPINRPALNSVAGRRLPPSRSPTPTRVPKQASGVSIPPKPSEIDVDDSPHSTPSKAAFAADLPLHNRQTSQTGHLDDYEKAMWNWVNVYNLDGFLQEVYQYYEGNGIYSIALSRGLNLLTVGFVIGFSTFLLGCIDYSQFRHGDPTQLSHVIIDRCVSKFSGFTLLFFILFTAFYFWQIVTFALGVMRLVDMYNFYTHLLKIPDADIQTVSWPEIVRRIGAIREENPLTAISSRGSRKGNNPSTAKLDAHDIANRIMRQENYLIALFNKELLDLRVPMPNMLKRFIRPEEGKGKMLTQALEWNLRFCLMEYLFDQHGRVRKVFLKSKNRRPLIDGLRRRFIFMGILNAIFAPFIVLYLIMYSFFRYFEEYHKDPSSIGGRRYTSYAQWKFREFNELPHVFKRRLDESYPIASIYIGQFPNDKITIIMRFVAFIAGSFAAVLALATLIDPDIFFHFEITPHRTVVFYLTVFGGILGAARGTIPEDNRVFDPELLMSEVITYTHYMPDEWKGLLHSKQIHQEFGELFAMKILIFMQELASVVLTPFILWYSLPECAPAIIDFFREFSVHVEGRGYVCSFAEFNFERHGNVKFGAPTASRDKRMQSNEGKMEKSFLNFKAANPDWNPSDPTGSLYLNRIAGATNHIYGITRRRNRENAAAMEGQVHFAGEPKVHESSLAERAQEYDRALRQSQYGASSRRRIGASMLGASVMGAAGAPSASSIFGGYSQTAQTAVLGDSQGSINLDDRRKMPSVEDSLPGDELEVSGSGLDGSYVDGAKRTKPFDDNQEEDDAMQDGGVLGLLAQIYGRHDGQGPVRGGVL